MPYNLDAWDGCAAARETVFGQRGYMHVAAKADECRANGRFVDTIFSRSFTAGIQKNLRALPGA